MPNLRTTTQRVTLAIKLFVIYIAVSMSLGLIFGVLSIVGVFPLSVPIFGVLYILPFCLVVLVALAVGVYNFWKEFDL